MYHGSCSELHGIKFKFSPRTLLRLSPALLLTFCSSVFFVCVLVQPRKGIFLRSIELNVEH